MKRLPTLKQLEYLVALAETQHFGRAAESCHITQSTLSAGIRDLEAVLGLTIAERSNRRVLMTPIGTKIADRGKALLRDATQIMELAADATEPMTGDFYLGAIPTISPFLLPRILPGLREKYPALTLYLREAQTATLLSQLRDGELDAILIALPYDTAELCVEVIFDDEFLFACGASHALAAVSEIPINSLEKEPLLLLEEGHCLRGHALDIFGLGDKYVRAQFEATSLHTLVQMVAAGIGVTLLPRLAVDAQITHGTDISTLPLAKSASRQIALVWRPTSARSEQFQLIAKEIGARVG